MVTFFVFDTDHPRIEKLNPIPMRYLIVIFSFLTGASFAQGYDTDRLTKTFHADRREALRKLLSSNSCAVFFSNQEVSSENEYWYVYHQSPNFYYLTGLNESQAMLIVFKETQTVNDSIKTNELLFLKDRDPSREVWTGHYLGKEGAKKELGFKFPLINTQLADLKFNFSSLDQIYLLDAITNCASEAGKNNTPDLRTVFYTKTGEQLKEKINSTQLPVWMGGLREVKQPEELTLMRKAIDMSCEAHQELMKALVPGMHEYQAQAVIEYMFKKNGSECEGYPSIVGGGENSCILHYQTNRKKLEGNNLLVIDAGAEYHGYTADVTRTLPVDGVFSKEEKIIYNIVLQAQEEGIKACKSGNEFKGPHYAASEVIQNKLMEYGIIKKKSDYSTYFFHGTSHYLGLDVHDAGNHGKLAPGNIITVEPGIYIPAGSACDPKWWNIGVRIEDDVLITTGEPDVLSGKLPRKAEEIEAIMKQESLFNKMKQEY